MRKKIYEKPFSMRLAIDEDAILRNIAKTRNATISKVARDMLCAGIRLNNHVEARRINPRAKKVSDGNRAGSGLSAVLPQKRANHDAAA